MRFGHSAFVVVCIAGVVLTLQSGFCQDEDSSEAIMAEVYVGDNAVQIKEYVQRVFRDVLFALTETLDNVAEDIETVEVTIKPNEVRVFVNDQQLEIKLFVEELYREIGLGILRAMGESPDPDEDYRIILYGK